MFERSIYYKVNNQIKRVLLIVIKHTTLIGLRVGSMLLDGRFMVRRNIRMLGNYSANQ